MKRGWSTRIVLKYTLLQLPSVVVLIMVLFVIRHWLNVPTWLVWGLVGLLVLKDIVMFPIVWRSYDQSRLGDASSMIGMRGTAHDRLAPSGYVHVHGELWHAEVMKGSAPIERRKSVRVHGIRGLTLLVQPEHQEHID
jgi:membrane-bound ClpP family serine protease